MPQAELQPFLETVPERSFPVQDPETVWLVRSGHVDIFLASEDEKGLARARHHILRVGPGSAIFGIGQELGVIGVLVPGAEVSRVHRDRLCQAVGHAADVAAMVEGWVTRLALAFPDSELPSQPLAITPGQRLKVSKPGQAIFVHEGVVWVKHSKGVSHFEGRAELPHLNGDHCFPLARNTWMQADQGAVVDALDSSAWLQSGPDWTALDNFHAIAITCFNERHRIAEQREMTRLRESTAHDGAVMSGSLSMLAAPLAGSRGEATVGEEGLSDPLFLACQTVGAAAGIKIKPYPELRRGARVPDPVSSIARASGVRFRRVALKGDWWKEDGGPILAFRDSDNRPVALLKEGGGYKLYDPIEGKWHRVTADLGLTVNPLGYIFYRPFPPTKLSVRDLLTFGLKGCQSELSAILLSGLAAGLLAIAVPFATGTVFDSVIPGAERVQLIYLSVLLVGIAAATAMFGLVRGLASLRVEGKMDSAVQSAVWDRLLSLPVPFFRDYSAGDLAMRSLGISQIRQALTGSALTSILCGMFSLFSLALLFYYSWRLALLASLLVAVAVGVSSACGVMQVRYQRRIFAARGRLASMVFQFITGVAKLRVAGAERRAFARWARESAGQREITVRSRKVSNTLTAFNSGFPLVCIATIFYYRAYLQTQPDMAQLTTGSFLAFLSAFTQLLAASLTLSSSVVSILNIVPLYERSKVIFQTLPEVDPAKASPGTLRGSIEVSHLSFRYKQDGPLILRDVSFTVEPGQFVAFVGPSGSGKSTLLRILLGFEAPESGAVYFDNQDLASLDVEAVRRQMGVVLQTGRLVNGDIYTNIVGAAALTLDDAWEAAGVAGIADDIKRFPMGMHTHIGEGGGISGGQRQRLMIARAIVGKPRILLFDEATSALDNRTQAHVSRSLESLKVTRIVIAHRLSTIVNADRIYVVDKGQIVQAGSCQELMEQEGMFRRLAQRQVI
jgi:ATP-binding cassette subfamily C protein